MVPFCSWRPLLKKSWRCTGSIHFPRRTSCLMGLQCPMQSSSSWSMKLLKNCESHIPIHGKPIPTLAFVQAIPASLMTRKRGRSRVVSFLFSVFFFGGGILELTCGTCFHILFFSALATLKVQGIHEHIAWNGANEHTVIYWLYRTLLSGERLLPVQMREMTRVKRVPSCEQWAEFGSFCIFSYWNGRTKRRDDSVLITGLFITPPEPMKVAPAVDAWDNKFSAQPKSANGCKWVLWNPRIQPYHGRITMGYSMNPSHPKHQWTRQKEHEKYQTVNCALSAQFALASWRPGKTSLVKPWTFWISHGQNASLPHESSSLWLSQARFPWLMASSSQWERTTRNKCMIFFNIYIYNIDIRIYIDINVDVNVNKRYIEAGIPRWFAILITVGKHWPLLSYDCRGAKCWGATAFCTVGIQLPWPKRLCMTPPGGGRVVASTWGRSHNCHNFC